LRSLGTYGDDNERGKTDRFVVPQTLPNNARARAAEAEEGRERTKGNAPERTTLRTQSRVGVSSALARVRQTASRNRKERFTALLHHVYDAERLRTAYFALTREAAAGIDGETWRHYGEALETNLGTSPSACSEERIERSRFGVPTSRRRTGGSDRSACPRWKTRSPSVLSSRC